MTWLGGNRFWGRGEPAVRKHRVAFEPLEERVMLSRARDLGPETEGLSDQDPAELLRVQLPMDPGPNGGFDGAQPEDQSLSDLALDEVLREFDEEPFGDSLEHEFDPFDTRDENVAGEVADAVLRDNLSTREGSSDDREDDMSSQGSVRIEPEATAHRARFQGADHRQITEATLAQNVSQQPRSDDSVVGNRFADDRNEPQFELPQEMLPRGPPSDDKLVIEAAETLRGSGRIQGDVFVSGLLSPGDSPGLLTIDGDLTITSSDPNGIDDNYIAPPVGIDTVGELRIEIGKGSGGTAGTADAAYDATSARLVGRRTGIRSRPAVSPMIFTSAKSPVADPNVRISNVSSRLGMKSLSDRCVWGLGLARESRRYH